MLRKIIPLIAAVVLCNLAQAQISFTNRTSLLTPANHYSGVAIAVLDMNGDGHDDIARMNNGSILSIAYQQAPNQNFGYLAVQDLPGDSQWGMCAADVDNNGFPDVLAGGYHDNVKIVLANDQGTAYTLTQLTTPVTFVQGVNFADINNDGWLDAFVCHDDGVSRIYGNDGAGNLVYQANWINMNTLPVSDNSGNYGTVWCDVDNDGDLELYIAKCRQGVTDPNDGRRINQLFWNNGDGTYTQDTANTANLRIGAQSWTADFGDVDNDGDFDCFVTNHDVKSMLLINDGAGHFTDISATSGVQVVSGLPIQGVFRDFDNDGYVDIIVAGSIQYLLHNNGNLTFSQVNGAFDSNQMESFAIGDLNSDGFLDVYAGYANIYTDPSNIPDKLWMNNGNNNHYFGLNLRGVQSNKSAVGARITMHTSVGIQIREVRSGESYGIMNSMQVHFGLGAQTQMDSVEIRWPSGHRDVIYNPAADAYITVVEGGCIVPSVSINALGATTFCSGDSVALEAPAGFSYLWSNGATDQTIYATEGGEYKVTVTTPEGCSATSNTISITVDPVEIPTVTVSGDTLFCLGGSVNLTASPAASYLWSNGATTQTLEVTAGGDYSVAAQGQCAVFNSAPVHVEVLSAALPLAYPDTVQENEAAVLTASGDSLVWYDMPGGTVLATGDTLTTLPLAQTTTFWVANYQEFDQPNGFVGQVDHQGTAFSGSQFNGGLVFDCFKPVRLARVKVYTNTAGNRVIVLKDGGGNVLQTQAVTIPVGTTVLDLNFDLPVGNDLLLTTDQDVNLASFNTVSPQLRRSDQGIAFPYTIPGVLSIKTSNIAADRYYYFYNWEIDYYGLNCGGTPIPVVAFVDTISSGVSNNPAMEQRVLVYPNPGTGLFTAELHQVPAGDVGFRVYDARGVLVYSEQLEAGGNRFVHTITLDKLPEGMYRMEWRHTQGVLRQTVLLVR